MIVREYDRAWTFLRLKNILKNETGTFKYCKDDYIKVFPGINKGNIITKYCRRLLWAVAAPPLYLLQIIDGNVRKYYVLLYIKRYSVRKFIYKLIEDLEKKRRR